MALSLFSIALLAALISSVSLHGAPAELRAVKITNVDSDILFSDRTIEEGMAYLASLNFNTVLVAVWNSNGADGSRTLYPSAVMDSLFGEAIHPAFKGRDPLQTLITEAHRYGLYVLPWFEMGFSSSWSASYESAPDAILNRYPHWASRTRDGRITWKNGFYWMNILHPEVQSFIRDLAVEVSRNYDIDGLEFSDRIPALPVEGGYDSFTVQLYQNEHSGAQPPEDPRDSAWMRWRADRMNAWFRSVRDAVHSVDADIVISSSPSVYPWSYSEYLQDPVTWMREGICDDIIPQLYRKTFPEYSATLDASLANYPGMESRYSAGIVLYQRLSDFSGSEYIMPMDYLESMMDLNREQGIHGEAWFFYEGFRKYPEIGEALHASWYAEKALPPLVDRTTERTPHRIYEEDDSSSVLTGQWTSYDRIEHHGQTLHYASIGSGSRAEYFPILSGSGEYNIYLYNTRQLNGSSALPLIIRHRGGTDTVRIDQRNPSHTGWTRLGTFMLDRMPIRSSLSAPMPKTVSTPSQMPSFCCPISMISLQSQLPPDSTSPFEVQDPNSPSPQPSTRIPSIILCI